MLPFILVIWNFYSIFFIISLNFRFVNFICFIFLKVQASNHNLVLSGILYNKEDSLLYHPMMPKNSRIYVPPPSLHKLPYQSVYTKSMDGTIIHMFFIPQPNDYMQKAPTILYLHGNAGNMGHR